MRIKIGTKIISGFLIIALLMLGLGIYSLFGQRQISNMNSEIVDIQVPSIMVAKDLGIYTMDKVAALRGFIITSDEEQINRFMYYKTQTQQYGEQNLNLSLTDDGKQQSQQLIYLMTEYDAIADRIIALRRAGYHETAVGEMNRLAFPKVQEIKQLAEDIISQREERIESQIIEMRRINDSIRLITILVLGISVIISIVVGTILTKSITKPINQLIEASKNIADGDLTKEITIKTRDEISLLVESFNKMVLNLRQIILQT